MGTNKRCCVFVCGVWRVLSRWTGGQYGWNKVTTETRVSKPGGLILETWHFQVALIPGYHINLTLLAEWPPERKWAEGHDLESTSQTSLATAHRESQGKLHSRSLNVPDGSTAHGNLWRPSPISGLIYKYQGNCHRMTTHHFYSHNCHLSHNC